MTILKRNVLTTLPRTSNLADLGAERDLADAAAIFDVFEVARRHPESIPTVFYLRAVGTIWQNPRLERLPGGHGFKHGIYRRALPWSLGAVELEAQSERVARGLVLEHVIPNALIMAAAMRARSPKTLRQVLRRDLILAVISRDEDRLLNAIGLGSNHPNPDDVLSRYREAGIELLAHHPDWNPNQSARRANTARAAYSQQFAERYPPRTLTSAATRADLRAYWEAACPHAPAKQLAAAVTLTRHLLRHPGLEGARVGIRRGERPDGAGTWTTIDTRVTVAAINAESNHVRLSFRLPDALAAQYEQQGLLHRGGNRRYGSWCNTHVGIQVDLLTAQRLLDEAIEHEGNRRSPAQ